MFISTLVFVPETRGEEGGGGLWVVGSVVTTVSS